MSEVVTAEQIEALQTDGFVVVDDLLTDAELDTFEPLVTAAVAYRSAGDERTLEEPHRASPRSSCNCSSPDLTPDLEIRIYLSRKNAR